jgi:hypothetical protein
MRKILVAGAAALAFGAAANAADTESFEIGNTVAQSCQVSTNIAPYGNLNLTTYTGQTVGSISPVCNYGGNATLKFQAAGKLTHSADTTGIAYTVGTSGGSFQVVPGTTLTPAGVTVNYVSPGPNAAQTKAFVVTLIDPARPLAAGDYKDTVTVSITP